MQTQLPVVDNLHESAPIGNPAAVKCLKKGDKDFKNNDGEDFLETLKEVTTDSKPPQKAGSKPVDAGSAEDPEAGDVFVQEGDSDLPAGPDNGAGIPVVDAQQTFTDVPDVAGGAGVRTDVAEPYLNPSPNATDGKTGGGAPGIGSRDSVIRGDLSASKEFVAENRESPEMGQNGKAGGATDKNAVLPETGQAGKVGGATAKNSLQWASENAAQNRAAAGPSLETPEAAPTLRHGRRLFQKEPGITSAGQPGEGGKEMPLSPEGKATRNSEDLLSNRNHGSFQPSASKTVLLNQPSLFPGQEIAGNAAGGGESVTVETGTGPDAQAVPGFSNEVKGSQAVQNTGETQWQPRTSETGFLSQIVERAVLSLKKGQSEMKITLKPEFLGSVRMHVSTENQHVTVKIVTETHGVKAVIENNLGQLKADLQNQGLKVDSFDVSTSENPHGDGGHSRHLNFQKSGSQPDIDQPQEKEEIDVESRARMADTGGSSGVIDFFA